MKMVKPPKAAMYALPGAPVSLSSKARPESASPGKGLSIGGSGSAASVVSFAFSLGQLESSSGGELPSPSSPKKATHRPLSPYLVKPHLPVPAHPHSASRTSAPSPPGSSSSIITSSSSSCFAERPGSAPPEHRVSQGQSCDGGSTRLG